MSRPSNKDPPTQVENVKVFIRKRPFVIKHKTNNSNKKKGRDDKTDRTDRDILSISPTLIKLENLRTRVKPNPNIENKVFKHREHLIFLPETTTNQDLYNNLKEDINQFLKGNITGLLVLGYGQTGSGKTHTMTGTKTELGLIQLYFQSILTGVSPSSVSDTNPPPITKPIYFSSFEIYNENIYDLIKHKEKLDQWVPILKYKNKYRINNLQDVTHYLEIINKNKVIGSTKLNEQSSRSHTIYKIEINNKSIIFIDLAGTERGKVTLANNKQLLTEVININRSLFALKECIRSLREKHKLIPFRSSKLTIVLRDIFQQGFDIRFIATLNPSNLQFHDTLDTIRYAISLSYSNLKHIEVFEKRDQQERRITQIMPIQPIPSNKASLISNQSQPELSILIKSSKSETLLTQPVLSNRHESSYASIPLASNDLNQIINKKGGFELSNQLPGFKHDYFNYIIELHNMLEKDKILFTQSQLRNIPDKLLSRQALKLLYDKSKFINDYYSQFIKTAKLEPLDKSNKHILTTLYNNDINNVKNVKNVKNNITQFSNTS